MPPKNESAFMNGTLYLNGEPIAIGKMQLPEITLAADAPEPDSVPGLQLPPLTFYIKTSKRWSCRSRKRFIKLMMSEGISRNYAEWLAGVVRRWKMPYKEAWRNYAWQNLGSTGR